MLTPGTLQCSNPRMMVWTELAKAYGQRQFICSFTSH